MVNTTDGEAARADISVDHLPAGATSLEIVLIEGGRYGSESERGPRRPHRHDYHELVWTRLGTGRHLIDGEPSEVEANSITLIGRGQVHVFERASGLHGAIVRFGDELLHGGHTSGANPAWLIGSRAVQTVGVPPAEVDRLEAAIELLAAEAHGSPDSRSVDVQRHLLSALLLWIERWYDVGAARHREADDPALQHYRRFSELLERDYTRHHDARHYADELGVPQAALSRALAEG